jgi:hypothetical protein
LCFVACGSIILTLYNGHVVVVSDVSYLCQLIPLSAASFQDVIISASLLDIRIGCLIAYISIILVGIIGYFNFIRNESAIVTQSTYILDMIFARGFMDAFSLLLNVFALLETDLPQFRFIMKVAARSMAMVVSITILGRLRNNKTLPRVHDPSRTRSPSPRRF